MDSRFLNRFLICCLGISFFGCDGTTVPHVTVREDGGIPFLPVLRDAGPYKGEPPASGHDGGDAEDAGDVLVDAAVGQDGGAITDASMVPVPDAAADTDAGLTIPDAGTLMDAGGAPDASAAFDAGTLPDAGQSDDAGSEQLDAGDINLDAGQPSEMDGGDDTVDSGPVFEFVAGQGERCFLEGGTTCDVGLVCADIYEPGIGICEYPCDVKDQPCATGGICTDLGFLGSPQKVCANPVSEGDACETEALRLCSDGSQCITNTAEPLGGTCRIPCSCSGGPTCENQLCGDSECVVLDRSAGDGFCGTAVAPGGRCSPIDEALLCAGSDTSDATCLLGLGETEVGVCHLRCSAESDCTAVEGTGCMIPPDGLCMPLDGLGQGELCTLDGANVPHTMTCAAGFDCLGVHEAYAPDFGVCLPSCTGNDSCEEGSDCYLLESQPDIGPRCYRELPRGARGCNPPEPICAGENGMCAQTASGEGICKMMCTLAKCPGPECECQSPEACIDDYVASDVFGICGSRAGWQEPCDTDLDVYCSPAPGQEIETNAIAICMGTCDYFCQFEGEQGALVELNCPVGYACREDPSGRWLPPTQVCVPETGQTGNSATEGADTPAAE